MYYLKVSLSILLPLGTFASLVYSVILLVKFLRKRSSKHETMRKHSWLLFVERYVFFWLL
jgi:hypothetical protein